MADFRIDTGFFGHIKTKRLRKRLGLEGVFALQMLWAYAAQCEHDEGRIYTREDIELAVDWSEDGDIVQTLVDVGFLDEVQGGYVIHEWEVHNGYAATASKRSEAGRTAAKARWDKRLKCDGNANASRSHNDGNAPFPIPVPIPSPNPVPDPVPGGKEDIPQPDGAKKKKPVKTPAVYSQDFEAFWEAYPARNGQKTKKAKTWDAFWKITTTTSITPEHLTERIKALSPQYGDFPRDAVTWLNQRGWEDEVVPMRAKQGQQNKAQALQDQNAAALNEWLASGGVQQ